MIEIKTFYVIDVMSLPEVVRDDLIDNYCAANDSCKIIWNNGETEFDDWMLENGIPINAEVLLEFSW